MLRKGIASQDSKTHDLKHKIKRSGLWASYSFVVSKVFQITSSIIIARILYPEDYGMNGIIWAILMLMEQFTQMGMQAAVIQNTSYTGSNMNKALDTLFIANVARGILLGMFMFFSAHWVSVFYQSPELENLIKFISLYFFVRGLVNVGLTVNMKNIDFKKIEIWEQASSSISYIIMIVLAYTYRSVWALVYGSVIGAVLYTITTYFISPYKPRLKFDKKIFCGLFSFGKYFVIIQILILITSKIDNIVIGKVIGLTELGFYVLAYRIVCLNLIQLTKLIYKITFPAIASVQDSIDMIKNVFNKSIALFLTFVLPCLAFLYIFAPDIILIVYGKKWLPVVPVFKIMIVYGIFKSVEYIFKSVFEATGNIQTLFKIHMICVSVFIIFIYPITKTYGIIGTAFLCLFVTILFHFISWPIYFRRFQVCFKDFIGKVCPPIISAIIMVMVVLIINYYALMSFHLIGFEIICKLFIATIVYLAIFYGLTRTRFVQLILSKWNPSPLSRQKY